MAFYESDIDVCCPEEVFEDEPIVTNGDRIRAMTDEELANFIACDNMCLHCGLYGKDCMNMEFLGCEDGILNWLKQEVDHESKTD